MKNKYVDIAYLLILLLNSLIYIFQWGAGIKIHPVFGLVPTLLLIVSVMTSMMRQSK